MPVDNARERVFLLGGANDDEGKQAVADCYELTLKGKKHTWTPIENLPSQRLSMAACVSEDCSRIYVAGGT